MGKVLYMCKSLDFRITRLVTSAAFGTINWHKLLDILIEHIEEDELRMIRYLLSETVFNVEFNKNDRIPFALNVGTPLTQFSS